MGQKKQETSAQVKHPRNLVQGRLKRVYVFKRQAQDHGVERPSRERELARRRLYVLSGAATLVCSGYLRPRWVESHHVGPKASDSPSNLPLATPDVQNPPCSSKAIFG